MDGIINIYKEDGYTSHDVVAKLRKILHMKKIGHTGTLDPAAEGVLPVCCGRATKAGGMLSDMDKSYHAVCRLGVETDTQDMTGKIIREEDVSGITPKDVESCAKKFEGEIMQTPPMYSALKVNGRKLYEIAREGKTVDRKPRAVKITSIDVSNIDLDGKTFEMDVTCSKGTYIRTLCSDIGRELGACAVMQSLVRTRVAMFSIEDAVRVSEVERVARENPENLRNLFMDIDRLFPDLRKFVIKKEFFSYLANGNPLDENMLCPKGGRGEIGRGEKILVYNADGEFKAIYYKDGKKLKVGRMF